MRDGNPVKTGDWFCVGQYRRRVTPSLLDLFSKGLSVSSKMLPGRVVPQQWRLYRIRLIERATAEVSVPRLMPVTEDIITQLRSHPDHNQNHLRSGLNFWDHGFRHAYVWLGSEGPLCIEWLLTEADNDRLRTLPNWAGMYRPLSAGQGQLENLFTFSNVRRRGIATQFAYGMYEVARRAGLRDLVTHIYEKNQPANAWAQRTGWRSDGCITRYQLDFPGLRASPMYVHRQNPRSIGERVWSGWLRPSPLPSKSV